MLAVLVVLWPDDHMLAASGRPSALPQITHALLHGPALAWAKEEGQALFPQQAPEA
jgi:hypothetical protein